jgi:hypothetical protein
MDYLGMCQQHGRPLKLADQLVALSAIEPEIICTTWDISVDVLAGPGAARGHIVKRNPDQTRVQVVTQIDLDLLDRTLLRLLRTHHTGSRREPPRPSGFFTSTRFRYSIAAKLSTGPSFHLPMRYQDGSFAREQGRTLESEDQVRDLLSMLSSAMRVAKERGEIWPPVEQMDRVIANEPSQAPYSFDCDAIAELEAYCLERFLDVDAIATVSDETGSFWGFTSLSFLTEARQATLATKFNVTVLPNSCMTEFGLVHGEFRSHRAFESMNEYLIEWWLGTGRSGERRGAVYGEVLHSQRAAAHVVQKTGYRHVGSHTIDRGFERGRTLNLFEFIPQAGTDRLG